jgi:Tfp pilus assembly pilus retraction ATPase PilT
MTLFENICSPLINDLIENKKSGLIFAYGITNSGKTFTITGLNIKIKIFKNLYNYF